MSRDLLAAAEARIPFAKAVAPYIRERLWHPLGQPCAAT